MGNPLSPIQREVSNLFHNAEKELLSTEATLKSLKARLPESSEVAKKEFDRIIGLVMGTIDATVAGKQRSQQDD